MSESPDFTPYVNLDLLPLTAQGIFERALLDLQTKLPDWTPQEGNTEVMLMESLALEVVETLFVLNTIPETVVDGVLLLQGVTRDLGAPPVAELRFTMSTDHGHVIPAGTTVSLGLADPMEDPIIFTTDEELVIPEGETSGVVGSTGSRATTAAHNVPAGTVVEALEPNFYLENVVLELSPSDGRDPETIDEYRQRGVNRFQRMTETLILPQHFTSAALSIPGIFRAFTVDNYDANPESQRGTVPGHVTVYVYGEDDRPVDEDAVRDLALTLDERSVSNLVTHIAEPTITDIDVRVDVMAMRLTDVEQVRVNIETELRNYLNPNTWEWGSVVRRNEIISLISHLQGVDFVIELYEPASNVYLTGIANLVRVGDLTINVSAPGAEDGSGSAMSDLGGVVIEPSVGAGGGVETPTDIA